MSNVYLPDPHPGRCLNLRPAQDAQGYPTSMRCLRMDGHEGKCKFDAPPAYRGNGGGTTCSNPEPKPWVERMTDAETLADHDHLFTQAEAFTALRDRLAERRPTPPGAPDGR